VRTFPTLTVLLQIAADKVAFYQSYFFGYQDTLFSGVHSTIGRQYFKECYIVGAVDFIFGTGSSYFDSCTLASNGPGHLTAQKRMTSNDSADVIKPGYIFNNCRVVADTNTNGVNLQGKVDLGRPWSKYARVVYMTSYFSDIIAPKGWGNWYSSTLGDYSNVQYFEYNNTGPGSWAQVSEMHSTSWFINSAVTLRYCPRTPLLVLPLTIPSSSRLAKQPHIAWRTGLGMCHGCDAIACDDWLRSSLAKKNG
jgi:pectin methylesterase-like acyl-CoA thioesterase